MYIHNAGLVLHLTTEKKEQKMCFFFFECYYDDDGSYVLLTAIDLEGYSIGDYHLFSLSLFNVSRAELILHKLSGPDKTVEGAIFLTKLSSLYSSLRIISTRAQ